MQTRKERAEISISDPGKKPYLSSDRDSIAVDRGRARDGLYIIRKGIALIDCLRQLIDAR